MIHGVEDCRLIEFPKVHDPRGNLTFVEGGRHVPFAIRRAYWIYGVPGGEKRGGHAYRELHEVVIALSGSFEVHLDDGSRRNTYLLNRGYVGLYVPNMIWRELESFSTNAVCLILASEPYAESDYVRDLGDFLAMQRAP
ncbi:MAG: FdtA/QdtA family cupin domain-containing protein [Actinomycetota bacterium]|nr:FdtA/QdtA family cupin domain-containing protein [Actinomycetota bacterium]